jgi:hypothetical protein
MTPKTPHLTMMKININGGQLWNGFLGGGSKFVLEHLTAGSTFSITHSQGLKLCIV